MSQQNVVGKTKYNLGENKWFAYSGLVVGDVSVPASVELINIPNTGLRNAFVKIKSVLSQPVSTAANAALGISVLINDIEVINSQAYSSHAELREPQWELFIPYQSKFVINSLNTSGNNTMERGVVVLGWYFG